MTFGFDTVQLRGGSAPDRATGAIQTPLYQTVGYAFTDADQAAGILNLQDEGYSYSRFTNPTISALGRRMAALDGGVGGVACASGRGAIILALYPVMSPGKHIVSSNRLYRGTHVLFTETMKKFGWSASLVDFDDLDAVRAAIGPDTRAIFCEGISNPGNYMTDIAAIKVIAAEAGLPLIVENSLATPYLLRPIAFGADVVVYSATKFMSGNGTVIAGGVVDAGRFNWSASGKFPSLSEPEPTCSNIDFHETFGPLALTRYIANVGVRDIGLTLNPQAAHYVLLGLETLSLRMARHVSNTRAVAEWLAKDSRIEAVEYLGLESSPYVDRVARYSPNGAGAVFTFSLKAGYEACVQLIANLKLFTHAANLGDARSLIVHAASVAQRKRGEPAPRTPGNNVLRVSIGTECAEDLIADLDAALTEARA
ncbi:O-acetylhomoserine (thiol)-lyase [Rhodoblastus acidophilus]|uniref:O-acetylhomoserine aminocarboxypropyltransferase/cysteine synthase family protein n=1 Tax=Rhodoblastus acidophilus TaxID=1074 RepID=UPI0022245877|nr:PLP-dependent transferase [Rhodoblastus acidophilus]MCW2318670.1 O-acetylhomoserine (thiol)-lyase [Rhodoblastus acidophilus]